ncbi:hypothetical protein FBZ88_109114 [Nitrospirillum bahiense]|uniref:Uncharacterized protein n=1 Tax=Nitrospirillum amazonense TaxID=28077 RepID=A0A560FVP9_9PROT|nr:hypothetical protein FBZ88_109114 [Nitrospirillum amazonense]
MDDASIALIERNFILCGLKGHAIQPKPVRSHVLGAPSRDWFTDEQTLRQQVVPRFEAVTKGLIEDDAEASDAGQFHVGRHALCWVMR